MMYAHGPPDVTVTRPQLHACTCSFFEPGNTHLALIAVTLQDLFALGLPCYALVELLILIHNNAIKIKSLTFWLSGFT